MVLNNKSREGVKMNDPMKAVYEKYEEKLRSQLAEVKKTKEFLNSLAKEMEIDIPFPEVSSEDERVFSTRIRADHFFGKPLATAVREYLEMRRQARPWDEIAEALRQGGFELGTGKIAEEQARTTILKNTANFVLIGDNNFGLKEWYPKLKKEQKDKDAGKEEEKQKKSRQKKQEEEGKEPEKTE